MDDSKALTPDPSDCTLEGVDMLVEAPAKVVRELEKSCRWIKCESNQVIVDRDDDTSEVFFIIKGSVKVMQRPRDRFGCVKCWEQFW